MPSSFFCQSAVRRAASSAATAAAAAAAKGSGSQVVPDVLVSFGTRTQKMTFISHPGVMAVARLLEMRHITRPRATLTQQNVDAIREFDVDLARKAQIALDNDLSVNFLDLEHIEKTGFVEELKREKAILDEAAEEVLKSPPGQYSTPKILEEYRRPEVPRSWRPELEITKEILEAQPGLDEDLKLQDLMKQHLNDNNNNNTTKVVSGKWPFAIGGGGGVKTALPPSGSSGEAK